MREQIIEIVSNNQKNFSSRIKQNPDLMKWVEEHTLVSGDVKFSEKIYSAIYQESGICPRGNKRSFETFSTGYRHGCGHSSVCQCCKESTAKKLAEINSNYTDEQKQEIQQKRENTMIGLYGVPFSMQREEVKVNLSKPKMSEMAVQKLHSIDWLNEEYNNKQRTLVDIASECEVNVSTVMDYCKKYEFKIRKRANYSMPEIEVKQFIESLGFTVEHSNWDILEKQEIDLFVPEKNIGIEIDGLYWHSFNPYKGPLEEKKYAHLEKTVNALKSKVELIHITDYEWKFKNELVKSLLIAKLGKATRIFARKCEIRKINVITEKEFLIKNHFQGYIPSSFSAGLYYENELVSIMTICLSRFDKTTKYELLRFCNKLGTVIIGGAEKLFNAILTHIGDESITSYCDISKFNGNIYKTLGFVPVNKPTPGYFWTDGDETIISRFKCQKKNLKEWLPSFDETKSEADNMFAAGFRRFWDCGQQKFIKEGKNATMPIVNEQIEEIDVNLPIDIDEKEITFPKVKHGGDRNRTQKTPEVTKQVEINNFNDLFSESSSSEELVNVPITPPMVIPIIEVKTEPSITNQREQILALIESKPKHYAKMVKSNPVLWKWVTEKSLITVDNVAEMIHSAMNQIKNICQYGNTMRFISFKDGYGGCGPGCTCANEKRSISSKESHSLRTQEEKAMAVQKRRETNLKEYGHINAAQTQEVKQKHKEHYDSLRTKIETVTTNSMSDADRGYERFKKTVNATYNFTLLTPRDYYHGIQQKDAYEYRFQCNSCGAIQSKKFNHARGIVCHVCNGGQKVEEKKSPQETINRIIESNPTTFSRIIKNDSNLVKWINENTLVQSTNFAEICYSALHQVNNVCENGKIKNFTSIKDGYRGCGRAGVCQCANDLLKQSLKNANTLIQEKRDIVSNNGNEDIIISDELKNRLLALFEGKNAKAYPTIIRYDIDLYQEIVNATNRFLPETDSERCYIILNGEPPKCKYGNKRKYNSFVLGYRTGCIDPECNCARESQREKMSAWHASNH
jgi:hypothetical protein